MVGLTRPHIDEYDLLDLQPGTRAYVREVLLLCNEVPVVFAHSVVPIQSLRGGLNGITHLGNRPLGEALFSNHRIQRQALNFRQLRHDHPLFQTITRQQGLSLRGLWARRSVFCLDTHPLLVTEVFLPAITRL